MFRASRGNLGPRDVDEMYLWEIAILLGRSEEVTPKTDDKNDDSRPKRPGRVDGAADLLKKRMLHARGLGPKPEAPPIDRKAFEATAGALRVGS